MNIMIIGCGRLSRLLALEGKKLDYEFTFVAVENEPTDCVEGLGLILKWNPNMSTDSLLQASGIPDVVTTEKESIDAKLLFELSLRTKVYPSPESISICQNRLKEKLALTKANIPVTPWLPVNDKFQLESAVVGFGFPSVIKVSKIGYDRRKQWIIYNSAQLDELIEQEEPKDWVVEPMIASKIEVSIIGVRSSNGETALYSITENSDKSSPLSRSIAPQKRITKNQSMKIKNYIIQLLESWNYVGVLTMKLFVTDKEVMVSKLVPRVHNSGYWTLNQITSSQFENHLRAITGAKLGDTKSVAMNGLINIPGQKYPIKTEDIFDSGHTVYDSKLRKGEKTRHLHLTDISNESLLVKIQQAENNI